MISTELRQALPKDARQIAAIMDAARTHWPAVTPVNVEEVAHDLTDPSERTFWDGENVLWTYANAASTDMFLGYPFVPSLDGERERELLLHGVEVAHGLKLPADCGVPEPLARERAMLEDLGFTVVRRFVRMILGAETLAQLDMPVLPGGATFAPLDAEPFRALHNAAFSDHFGFSPLPAETVAHWYAEPDFDARDWEALIVNGEAVAYAHTGLDDGVGWVHILGTLPEHQKRGHGRVMLTRAAEQLRKRGAREVRLGVDIQNAHDALGFYERVGFKVAHTILRYRKETHFKETL